MCIPSDVFRSGIIYNDFEKSISTHLHSKPADRIDNKEVEDKLDTQKRCTVCL